MEPAGAGPESPGIVSGNQTHPEVPPDRAPRGSAWLWLAAFAGALVLYVTTLAPDLVWQDGGEYQLNVARLTWPPAQGTVWSRPGTAVRVHPWFLVTARALWWPRFWTYAYAANLCSAASMAVAAANVALLVFLLTGRRVAAVVGGLVFALGHTVWTFGVMSEVLGWTAAFLSAECLCAWAWATTRRPRWLLLLFLLNGAAISNHMMAALSLAVFAVWVFVDVVRGRAPWWVLPSAAGLWVAGAALYWIVLATEYAGTRDLAGTLISATVGRYGGQAANVRGLPGLFGRSLLYIALNHPTPLVLAAVGGAVALWRRRDAVSRVILILAAVYFLWAARYKVPDQFSFFVPFYVLSSVLIGVGAGCLLSRKRLKAVLVLLALLPVGVYAVLPSVAEAVGFQFQSRVLPYRDPYTYFVQPWKRGYEGARRFAEEALDSLPPKAVLMADSTSSAPLQCVWQVEGRRPDVVVVGLGADITDPFLGGLWGTKEDPWPQLNAEGRLAFVVSDVRAYIPRWVSQYARLKPFGIIYEAEPRGSEGPG